MPLYWNHRPSGFSFWALLRHADALTVFDNPGLFTSERGMQVGQEEAAARAAAGRVLARLAAAIDERLRRSAG